jgi:hypothetical protein
MEAIYSYETSVGSYRAARSYNSEDHILLNEVGLGSYRFRQAPAETPFIVTA